MGERVNTDLFMVKDRNASGTREALANLKGKRYVIASELEDGTRSYFPNRILRTLKFDLNEQNPTDQRARLYSDRVFDISVKRPC